MTGRGTNAYLLPGGHPTLIDAPEASDAFVDRVAEALDTEQPGTPLSQVLITHFHHDHIDGVEALAKRWPASRSPSSRSRSRTRNTTSPGRR